MSTISSGTTSTTTLVHSGDTTGSLVFKTNDTGSGGTTAVTINTSQAIGVGSSPSYGTSGQVLTSSGSGSAPTWTTVSVSAATATALGTVYGRTTGDISPATPHKLVSLGYNVCTSVTGSSNVIVGADGASSLTSGAINIGIGRDVFQSLTTGNYNTHIGYATSVGASGRASSIVICSGPSGATDKGDNTGFIAPNSNGAVYQGNNSSSWSTTSDRRLKKNIADNTEGLDKITQIRVCNFEYRLPEEVDAELKPSDAVIRAGVQLGVIAQELQQVCPDCVKEESTGVLSVDSDNVFWHMVNAIKDLKAIVDAQAVTLATQATEIAELKAKVG